MDASTKNTLNKNIVVVHVVVFAVSIVTAAFINSQNHTSTSATPVKAVRDQTDLQLFTVDGSTWIETYDTSYSPTSVATPLKTGANLASIGGSGHNEWFKAASAVTVTVQGPAPGRVFVFSADGTPIYDSRINTGAIAVTQGCFIEVVGYAGDAFILTAT